MSPPRSVVALAAVLAFASAVPAASAQDAQPQTEWMVHMDGSADTLRYIPDRITLVPGGTVQLMIFGNGHGRYSLTLIDVPEREAEVDTARPGFVHVAEFAAPDAPGEYPFHDKHHPAAKGVLVVQAAASAGTPAPTPAPTAAAPPASPTAAGASDDVPTVGVGNGYDTKFYPARVEVRAGESVRFRNNASELIHTMTAVDGSFDADAVRAGEERMLTAPLAPGEYEFICKYHAESGMRGTLVVLPAAAGVPANGTPREVTPADSTPAESTEGAGERGVPGIAWAGVLAAFLLAAVLLRRR